MSLPIGVDSGGADQPNRRLGLCPNALMLMAATEASVGIGLLPCALGDQNRSLKRISANTIIEGLPTWLLMHEHLRDAARVLAVTRWTTAAFARNKDLLRGLRAA